MYYTIEQIRDQLKAATKSQSESEYVEKMLSSTAAVLKADPAQYRYYGATWWLVKRMLLDSGAMWLDGHVDAEWLEKSRIGTDAENLMCASMVAIGRIQAMELPSSYGEVDIGGEQSEYVLNDEFMERLVSLKQPDSSGVTAIGKVEPVMFERTLKLV